jgi:hypothetical protein
LKQPLLDVAEARRGGADKVGAWESPDSQRMERSAGKDAMS